MKKKSYFKRIIFSILCFSLFFANIVAEAMPYKRTDEVKLMMSFEKPEMTKDQFYQKLHSALLFLAPQPIERKVSKLFACTSMKRLKTMLPLKKKTNSPYCQDNYLPEKIYYKGVYEIVDDEMLVEIMVNDPQEGPLEFYVFGIDLLNKVDFRTDFSDDEKSEQSKKIWKSLSSWSGWKSLSWITFRLNLDYFEIQTQSPTQNSTNTQEVKNT